MYFRVFNNWHESLGSSHIKKARKTFAAARRNDVTAASLHRRKYNIENSLVTDLDDSSSSPFHDSSF
jgi:hypothetical protein